ncbi:MULTISPECIES: hypothetical protein [Mycolicibacterium]|jgi:hypothetical protein|uniref:Secreted protein n=2 Tax=Mycolicibacterium TaxID=1866885 RepID=A0A378TCK4_9MYCO|nr:MULTISPECIES: hypothetical protein [Mycolicibacterium]ANW63081.1 hypothetical protein BCA37_05180 [Mycobacterium sp. djl-10]MCV7184315.1 hypothetical protein [Mycolicibacterium murale]STZ58562.1 Uncharacterised protein [Mycolicibacterium tokaiense]BBY86933.1 hypothetical protein MTOK_27150 [Mycolicibacterium tokaiense]GFG61835.1 hypothetical protein MMUR_59710 [Mycolicibacterium murale]
MKSRLTVAALLAAAGAAGAIMAAPLASAEPPRTDCTQAGNIVSGTSTVCQSPGNAQITSSPGQLGETQWGMWPWGGGMWVL